jgi:hypothetical protein
VKKFEWAVIGSGIAGAVAAEILTREGHSVVLLEKNEKLASETSREFHEWMHMGSLYTLIPDNLTTLKFVLGAIDDLLEFYSSFQRMNLNPTEKGMQVSKEKGQWFNSDNHIYFKFRTKGRKFTFPWLIGIARSVYLINIIKEHDWLRRRAGVVTPFRTKASEIWRIVKVLLSWKEKFFKVKTPDFTMNSRVLLRDLFATAINNGLQISTENGLIKYEKTREGFIVHGEKESYIADQIVLCNGKNVAEFVKASVKQSYAPMAVVRNVDPRTESFVELDYYPKNCINILRKEDGIGLIGGISFNDLDDCDPYIAEVFEKHKRYQPEIEQIATYVGTKSEVIVEGEPRNYLYHIKNIEDGVWMIIPGKFTLGFSIGPEFYRRVYHRNPRKNFETASDDGQLDKIVSNTFWHDALINNLN